MKNVTAKMVEQYLSKGKPVSIIDVREKEELASGMIPGAIHIPLGELEDRIHELDKNQEYIIVCHSGGRSFAAAQFLAMKGYKTANMIGGMAAWFGPLEYK